MARTRTKIEDDVDEDRIKPSRASKAGRASKARRNANADAEGEVLSRSGVSSAGADADQAARREEAAARRAARRERRAALMRALSERLSEAFVGLARFLWQYAWVFAMPLAVALAAALASYSPADPSFSVSTARAPVNLCGLWGAWAADLLFSMLGFSAWWLVLGLAMMAVFALRARWRIQRGETAPDRVNPPKFTAFIGLCALLMGSTSLEALRFGGVDFGLPAGTGGILGNSLARAVIYYVGAGVSAVVFLVLMAIGIALLLDFSWADIAEGIGRFIDEKIVARFRKDAPRTVGYSDAGEEVPAADGSTDSAADISALYEPTALRQEFEIVKPDLKSAGSQSLFVDQMITPAPQGFTSPARPSVEEAHPSLSLLDTPDPNGRKTDEESIQLTSRLIVAKLKSYNIDAEVLGAQPGPVITQYRLEPGPGVKGAQIESVRDDLRRALGVQAVRIVLSIPGTSCIGIEVPNPVRETVRLKEILKSEAYEKSTSALTLALGKDIAGHPVVIDLAKTPHLLVAGTTGSGKSVGINAMILSMLFRNSPKRLRLVLIDPKMLEFSLYNDIPHLLTPVVTDMNKASAALKWLTNEMDRRYAVMSRVGVRQFSGFNEKVLEAEARGTPIRDPMAAKDDPAAPNLEPWPYIVCVVDELADLMLTNRKEVEGEITRLTQKARAAGIHLILATQRPSVDVVTSLIKANVPSRIAFQVASATDSRVILGESGAEQLLGNGDMLFHRPGAPDARRIQGCFVDDGEVQRVAEALRRQGSPSYVSGVTEGAETADEDGESSVGGRGRKYGEKDPLYDEAVQVVLTEKRASISLVQRHLAIGYNRAANILEAMEAAGLVSKPNAMGKRTTLVPDREL